MQYRPALQKISDVWTFIMSGPLCIILTSLADITRLLYFIRSRGINQPCENYRTCVLYIVLQNCRLCAIIIRRVDFIRSCCLCVILTSLTDITRLLYFIRCGGINQPCENSRTCGLYKFCCSLYNITQPCENYRTFVLYKFQWYETYRTCGLYKVCWSLYNIN